MKNICLIFFLGLVMFSCQDPYENNLYKAYEELPVATYLKSKPEEFSMWVEVIERAGLFNTLNLNTTYTCFVPSNDAVREYLNNRNLTSVSELSAEEAAVLVKYHTIISVSFEQNMFTNGVIPYPTSTDDYLSVEFRDGGFNSIYINGKARIIELNTKVTNGVIHVIDHLLIPITESIYQKLDVQRYSIFKQALVAAGYQDSMNTITREVYDNSGKLVIQKYKFTVFAVSDSVYNIEGIASLDDLKTKLGVTGEDYTSSTNALNKYVSYHILAQTKSYSDLSDFPNGQTSMNLNTFAAKELMSLNNVNGELLININAEKKGTGFVKTDINCKNGVIHEVKGWMPVFTPPMVTVLWELTDYSDLAAVCKTYRVKNPSSSYTLEITDGLVTCYKWKAMPETKTGNVYYRNNRDADGVWSQTKNYDHLRLTLGKSGYIEMQTPVLIKGNYKVSLAFVSGKASTNTGIMQCSLDGQQLGGQVVISNTSKDQLKTVDLSSSLSFTETNSHTLRILSIDGQLLTLDYILFEPVN